MRKLKCIIVDDEPLALDLIEGYVLRTPFLQLAARCSNAYEAVEAINSVSVDLIFLDIQMPGFNGLEFSKTLTARQRVIFTTAFEKFALEGYKVEALDFLLKPFDYHEFLNAANKAKVWFELKERASSQQPDYIFVKSEYKQVRVALKEVLYFEAMKDYTRIWLEQDRSVMSLMSLKSVEEILPVSMFMRVHRSYIVALDKIREVERSQIIIHDKRITVAEQYKEGFQEYLSGRTL